MADALGTVKSMIPKIKGGGSMTVGIVAFVIFLIIFLAIIGVVTYFIVQRFKFKNKIIVFEKVNGIYQPTRKDRAMEYKIGKGGDIIFYLKKHKKFLPTPTLQTGIRTFWYFIRQDGEWINFTTGDFDDDSRKVHAQFTDKEMRFARTQIQKGLKERYDQPGFWKQYGLLVFSLAYIVIIGVMMWLFLDKWVDMAAATKGAMEVARDVLDQTSQILSGMDNICSGGSGYVRT